LNWSFDSLWQKAKVYMQRALSVERDGPMFPFWATLALEFLARACLAKVHPSLLADPLGEAVENLLYACGYPSADKQPRSIMAKTVFLRCQKIVPNFTEDEAKFCLALVDRRNRELHTGEAAFEKFDTALWLAEFYRVLRILLPAIERGLEDMLGADEVQSAVAMIEAIESKTKKKAFDAIAAARKNFQLMESAQKVQAVAFGSAKAKEHAKFWGKTLQCPACSATALMTGETVKSNEPRLEEGLILQEHIVLPTRIECFSCGLVLDSHAALYGAELGGQYTVTEEHDPVEFYKIDIASYFDPVYGND
jgi:hypothetical protein